MLGSSFLIEATASVDEPLSLFSGSSNNVYTNFGESGTFTIQDSNGNAVESILVTVPEPSFLALVGLPLALLVSTWGTKSASRLRGEG